MSFKINDISSLFSLGRLNKTHNSLSNSLEKFATGRRINRAADDASGLAIADSLESQRRGYVQSIRNATDAISIVQTADSAIGEMTNILQEMRTKAIQAASDSQSQGSRRALQTDINLSLEELNNISRTTSFNNQKLLSGQFSGKEFQVGTVSGETVTVNIRDISLEKLGGSRVNSDNSNPPESATELTSNLTTRSDLTTTVESRLESESRLTAQTELAAGSSIGFTLDSNTLANDVRTTQESSLQAGSTLGAGSIVAAQTELGGSVTLANNVSTSGESIIGSGSTLLTGSVLAAGTELTADVTVGGTTYQAGDILSSNVTLTGDETFSSDMNLATGSSIASGSTVASGSAIAGNITLANAATITSPTIIETGSTIADTAGTSIVAGSTIGGAVTLDTNTPVASQMTVASGSTIAGGSTLASDSTLGGQAVTNAPFNLGASMSLGAGTVIESGSVLKAGTMLTDEIQIAGGGYLDAGATLGEDVVTAGRNYLDADLTLAAESTLASGSLISPQVSSFSNFADNNLSQTSGGLADIDVTTMVGAQTAIETIDKALSELNQARSGLGSTQNQLISSIANVSVTMVNTAAAESTIADLDFAEESMNFNSFQILMKAQVFAQAQTNRIKGANIMNLLQG